MLELKDIISGLEKVKSSINEDSRFEDDRVFFNDLSEMVEEFQLENLIGISANFEGYIALNKDWEPFLISIRKKEYRGEIELNYSVQQLSLNGLAYFVKFIVNLNNEVKSLINRSCNGFLKNEGITARAVDLAELAVLNVEYNVYILSFESNNFKYWLTFRSIGDFRYLSKITKKANDIPVKIKKEKKLNINVF